MTWLLVGLRSYPLAVSGWWHGWRLDRARASEDRHIAALNRVADTSERCLAALNERWPE